MPAHNQLEKTMALLDLYREVWRGLQLRYYRLALANQQRVNPCHEDIPWLVRRINQLEK